jgi:hypothetical protein
MEAVNSAFSRSDCRPGKEFLQIGGRDWAGVFFAPPLDCCTKGRKSDVPTGFRHTVMEGRFTNRPALPRRFVAAVRISGRDGRRSVELAGRFER